MFLVHGLSDTLKMYTAESFVQIYPHRRTDKLLKGAVHSTRPFVEYFNDFIILIIDII